MFGIPFSSINFPRASKVMLMLSRCNVMCTAISIFAGFCIMIANDHNASSADVLYTIQSMMCLSGKLVGVWILLTRAQLITTVYEKTSGLRTYLSSADNKGSRILNAITLLMTVVTVLYNVADIWINSIPMHMILYYVERNFTDNSIVQHVLLVSAFPSALIFFGVRYNVLVVGLENLRLGGAIFDQLISNKTTRRTSKISAQPVGEENMMFTITFRQTEEEDEMRSTNLMIKKNLRSYQQISRAYYALSALRLQVDHIYNTFYFWIILCFSTDGSLRSLYSTYGVHPSPILAGRRLYFYTFLAILNLSPLIVMMVFTYKNYVFSIHTTKKAYLFADNKIKNILKIIVNQVNNPYLTCGQVFYEMDSTIFDLVAANTFLLMTTFM